MAYVETMTKVTAKNIYANGTDSSGNLKTVSVALPGLSAEGYNMTAVNTILGYVSDCGEKTLMGKEVVKTYRIESED